MRPLPLASMLANSGGSAGDAEDGPLVVVVVV